MSRPRLLDLFCGAGGASKGYAGAGFDIVSVDIAPQPRYPFELVRADALEILAYYDDDVESFAAIHASPPCQAFTAYQRVGNVGDYPDLVAPVRDLLERTGLPYVIENVVGAPLIEPILICGSMFDPVMDIRRHRLFEANWPLKPPVWPCRHLLQTGGRWKPASNRTYRRGTIEIGAWDETLADQREAMGIDWMRLEELSEAIPPAYTRLIGEQLLTHIQKHTSGVIREPGYFDYGGPAYPGPAEPAPA